MSIIIVPALAAHRTTLSLHPNETCQWDKLGVVKVYTVQQIPNRSVTMSILDNAATQLV